MYSYGVTRGRGGVSLQYLLQEVGDHIVCDSDSLSDQVSKVVHHRVITEKKGEMELIRHIWTCFQFAKIAAFRHPKAHFANFLGIREAA